MKFITASYGDALIRVVTEGGPEGVLKLLIDGIDINEQNDNDDTALIVASQFGRVGRLRLFLEGGAVMSTYEIKRVKQLL